MIDVGTSGIHTGDALDILPMLPPESVQCCVTSPPYYGLRSYFDAGDQRHARQIGLEATPAEYVSRLVEIFRLVRAALRDDGVLWLNLGDSYAGSGRGGYAGGKSNLDGSTVHQDMSRAAREAQVGYHGCEIAAGVIGRRWVPPPAGLERKNMLGMPWQVAFALRDDGWILRSDCIWSKSNPMPNPVRDRPVTSHEYVFLLSKSCSYFYDGDAVAEPLKTDPTRWRRRSKKDPGAQPVRPRPMFGGERNGSEWGNGETRSLRTVWSIATQPYRGAHFAVMPPDLAERCILSGSRQGDLVLDPFLGSGTVGMVAQRHGRRWIGIDLGFEELATERTALVDEWGSAT